MRAVVLSFAAMGLAACGTSTPDSAAANAGNASVEVNEQTISGGEDNETSAPSVSLAEAVRDQPHEGFTFAYSRSRMDRGLADAEEKLTGSFTDCSESGRDPNIECELEELDRQDAKLNAVYKKTMNDQSAPEKQRLRDLQRKWLSSVEEHCEGEANVMGSGSVAERQIYCRTIETIHRTAWLERYGR